jgi:hypothetical protein
VALANLIVEVNVSTQVLEVPQVAAPSEPHCTAPNCRNGRPPATHFCQLFCRCEFVICQPCAKALQRLISFPFEGNLECKGCFLQFKGTVRDFVIVLEPL